MKYGKRSTPIDRHVAKRLRAARIKKGISQIEAAAVLGISFQQLQKYESGSNRVTAGKLFLLARFYGKSLNWFFVGHVVADATSKGRRFG